MPASSVSVGPGPRSVLARVKCWRSSFLPEAPGSWWAQGSGVDFPASSGNRHKKPGAVEPARGMRSIFVDLLADGLRQHRATGSFHTGQATTAAAATRRSRPLSACVIMLSLLSRSVWSALAPPS